MGSNAEKTFYVLSGFLLMMAFFVLQPSDKPEISGLQNEMKQQFGIAWQQTLGDSPYFDTIGDVVNGILAFYDQSSEATIALLTQPDTDSDLYYVFSTTYSVFAQVFKHSEGKVAGEQVDSMAIITANFMIEPAIDNIAPNFFFRPDQVFQPTGMPVNANQPWVTLQDNFTGQIYCVALYNGEANKYLGACKNEYH